MKTRKIVGIWRQREAGRERSDWNLPYHERGRVEVEGNGWQRFGGSCVNQLTFRTISKHLFKLIL